MLPQLGIKEPPRVLPRCGCLEDGCRPLKEEIDPSNLLVYSLILSRRFHTAHPSQTQGLSAFFKTIPSKQALVQSAACQSH